MAKVKSVKTSSVVKATAAATDPNAKKCETCVQCRLVITGADGSYTGGVCAIGPGLRQSANLAPEGVCDNWEKRA